MKEHPGTEVGTRYRGRKPGKRRLLPPSPGYCEGLEFIPGPAFVSSRSSSFHHHLGNLHSVGLAAWRQCPPLYSCTHPQALTSGDVPSPPATACPNNPTLYCHSRPLGKPGPGPTSPEYISPEIQKSACSHSKKKHQRPRAQIKSQGP